MKLTRKNKSKGQAIVEFALILTVLLLIIFIIIEAGRLLWAWVTVQNAARLGARYAVTGQFDAPNCILDGHAKFDYLCDLEGGQRVASITNVAREGLTGLPLDETSGIFEDDNYYNVEVWGVNSSEQIQANFGGIPNRPVVVRVYYRVPIITPLLRPIVQSVPVFGQATMNNEAFGALGGNNQAQGVPPPLPALPTPGVTPSPTFTPTATTTPEPTETPVTPGTPTATPTDTPCRVRFTQAVVEGQNFFFINGEVGSVVTVINATTNQTIIDNVTLVFAPDGARECDGFAAPALSPEQVGRFAAGDVLVLLSSDGTTNSTIVLNAPPTATPTITNTPAPTLPPTSTPTLTPTPNPNAHFFLLPNCSFVGSSNQITLNIIGAANWDLNGDVEITWDGVGLETVDHPGDITNGAFGPLALTVSGSTYDLSDGIHVVRAEQRQGNSTNVFTTFYTTPCDDATPVPTATPTNTPAPADMIVVGPPQPVVTPVTAYDPVTYQVVISNTGDIDVNDQFFVDLFFNPSISVTNSTEFIPIADSVGYMAISQLPGRASRVLTITTFLGFENSPPTHRVYAMVDSILQVDEASEINNISGVHIADYVTPAATPTPLATPDPNGTDIIHGLVGEIINNTLVGYYRVQMRLWDGSTLIGQTRSDENGYFAFGSLPSSNYYVTACFAEDNQTYQWTTQTVSPPFFFYIDSLQPGPCQ